MITTIIFDLDGVLVDSQRLQYKSYNAVFTRYGFPIPIKDWGLWVHHSVDAKEWIQRNHLTLDPHRITEEKKVLYERLIDEEMELKPGVRDLITLLKKHHYRLCIASASRKESIDHIVRKFHLEEAFEHLLSDRDLQFPKPHPHIFLEAAKLMNAEPDECVVIEDSLTGLKAAKSAQMKCIICPDPWEGDNTMEYPDADVIVNSLKDVTVDMLK